MDPPRLLGAGEDQGSAGVPGVPRGSGSPHAPGDGERAVLPGGMGDPLFPRATRTRPFRRADGSDVAVPMMARAGTFHCGDFKTPAGVPYSVVEVPYGGGGVAMLLVAPLERDVPIVTLTRLLDGPVSPTGSPTSAPPPTCSSCPASPWRPRGTCGPPSSLWGSSTSSTPRLLTSPPSQGRSSWCWARPCRGSGWR
ncbi:uncharacterized protein LOC116781344 isoform X2 [Chiroxiphia lanceolata]|uniref:uncharacterized protein LOC116781344 isoform X2 n=1 Tax=Chiroxiphia lanceolata TaxID=296741 RepID=UPI0013CED6DC|nr:uncharacterized protein LOC116781344 isoform X2 [Chiroxiphia lanceolata]